MDNYFISFRLLTTLGISNISVTEIDYVNALSLRETAANKKPLWTVHINQKSSVTLTVVG